MTFWTEAAPAAKKALFAASLGWLLDAFDVMLYALILTAVVKDLGLTLATGGQLASLTLAASALGGLVFGVVADKLGRTRALSLSILLYSIFTFACGLAQNVWQLAIFRFLLGLGMGGEWASGATLVSETWPEKHRGKALGIMQSCWAIGYGAAAVVVALVLPAYVTYLIFAAVLVWAYGSTREPIYLLILGPFVAFFGTGYFSGFGAVASEIFPTAIRATALGVTYNSGRLLSAAAPLVIGTLAQSRGFGAAFTITAVAFLIAALLWIGIPETRGRKMV